LRAKPREVAGLVTSPRKIIALAVVSGSLVFAAPAFPLAITNPATGDCHTAVTPGTFNGNANAFPANPGGAVGPWDGLFNSADNSAISGVHC
jgi:hypothetical protein